MNQATKTQIESEAEIFAEVIQTKNGTISRLNAISWYSAGATKYAELLEQEKAKGEKLVAALEFWQLTFKDDQIECCYADSDRHFKPFNQLKRTEEALTDYKTTSK